MTTTLQLLKEIRDKIKSYIIPILCVSLVLGFITYFIKKSEKGIYSTYSKIFPLSTNASEGNAAFDMLKSQMGIVESKSKEKILNISELINSRTISQRVVTSEITNKKYNNLAEWIIDDYNNYLPFWKKKITINKKDTSSLIFSAASMLIGSTVVKSDAKGGGFPTIKNSFHEKELCKVANEIILKTISEFYIALITEKPRADLIKIKIMKDSLRDELYAIERAMAGFQDANLFPGKSVVGLPQEKLKRAKTELEGLYAVTSSSYQNAKFTLLSESPIFQILDYPGEPYEFVKPNGKKDAMIVFFVCFFLLCVFVCRKIFYNVIKEELSKT